MLILQTFGLKTSSINNFKENKMLKKTIEFLKEELKKNNSKSLELALKSSIQNIEFLILLQEEEDRLAFHYAQQEQDDCDSICDILQRMQKTAMNFQKKGNL